MAFLQRSGISADPAMPTTTAPGPMSSPSTSTPRDTSLTSARSLRQLSIFVAGASFFTIASLVTRRSVIARHKSVLPKFYQPSNQHSYSFNGAFEAFEALSIATVNVVSVSVMVTGGAAWACDISNFDELRTTLRRKMGFELGKGGEAEVDKETEEWLASVFEKADRSKILAELAKGPPGKRAEWQGTTEEELKEAEKKEDEEKVENK